jgi:hypothetical protein
LPVAIVIVSCCSAVHRAVAIAIVVVVAIVVDLAVVVVIAHRAVTIIVDFYVISNKLAPSVI